MCVKVATGGGTVTAEPSEGHDGNAEACVDTPAGGGGPGLARRTGTVPPLAPGDVIGSAPASGPVS